MRNRFLALLLGATLALGALGGTAQATGEVLVQVECEVVTVTNGSTEEVQVGQKVIEAPVNMVAPDETFTLPGPEGVTWYVYSENHGYLEEGVFTECPPEPDPEPEPDDETTEPDDEGTEAPGVRVEDETEASDPAPETDDEVDECVPADEGEDETVEDVESDTLPFTGIEPWMIPLAVVLTTAGAVAVRAARKIKEMETENV